MTIKEIIDFVDGVKPNAFSNQQKTVWLNEVEGMVQTDVLLLSASSIVTYLYESSWSGTGVTFPDDATMLFPSATGFRPGGMVTTTGLSTYGNNNLTALKIKSVGCDGKKLKFAVGTFGDIGSTAEAAIATVDFNGSATEMLVLPPHHKIYYTYLMAMIDFANGEYGKYQNTMTLFNTFFGNFTKWFIENYRPSDGKCLEKGYYISAYAIAVKHGFSGTETDFLSMLKGEKGEIGNGIYSVEKTSGTGTPGTTDTYTIIMTDGMSANFSVYNGRDGETFVVDSALSALSTNPVENRAIKTALDMKADLIDGTIPASQLPSYVDDVIEVATFAALPTTGEAGKIYVTLSDNKVWRWSGNAYAEISASLALGETAATAYRGDRGKVAYDHSQTTGNPHATTKSDVGLGNVENTSDADKPVSTATQTALNAKQNGITNTANQVFYGSGTIGALNQLGFPSTDGSFLRQNTSGAPFFSTPAEILTAIGAQKNLWPVNSAATSISVPTGTGTVLKSQSLSAGTYLLFGYAQFPNNSTGVRGISISTSSTFDDGKATKTPACNGWETAMTCWFYLTLASTTTVCLAAYQNSGSTLTVSVANFLALKVA